MLTRRSFLQKSALSATALSFSARSRAAVEGANGDIRIAVIGFNGRGADHIANYQRIKGVRITALCDVDTFVIAKGAQQLKQKGIDVTTFQDIRKLLASKDIDAISIATPNHWHSLAAIWGVQAGKDVYVEKPVSHNVWEGRQLVKATAKTGQIVQMGVQSRSAFGLQEAIAWAAAGNLGKLHYARGLCYKPRPTIGQAEGDLEIPKSIAYDLWCGPAAYGPLKRKRLHYDWHWVWNTGNGDLGNQGIHQMDIARRFTGEKALAPHVFAVGGRLGYVDDGETPNSLFLVHEYANAPLIFEVRGLPDATGSKNMDKYRGASVGVVVQYEGGHILCPDYNNAVAFDKEGKEIKQFRKTQNGGEVTAHAGDFNEDHYENFIEAVRSRKPEMLHGRIEDGHVSSALCHTGNISYRLGQKASPDEVRESVKGSKDAMDSLERLSTHLAANEVDVKVDQLTLGVHLKMDPKTERFVDNPEADKLLTREYRAPFVVPEIA